MKIESVNWSWSGSANQEKFNLSEQVANEAMGYIENKDYDSVESAQEAVNNAVDQVIKDHLPEEPNFGNYLESCSFSPAMR